MFPTAAQIIANQRGLEAGIRSAVPRPAPIPRIPVPPVVKGIGALGAITAAIAVIGAIGGNQFRDEQLRRLGREFDVDTGLSRRPQEPNMGERSTSAPPAFEGGQSGGIAYKIQVLIGYDGLHPETYKVIDNGLDSAFSPRTDAQMRVIGLDFIGAIGGVGLNRFQSNGKFITVNGSNTPSFVPAQNFGTAPPMSITIVRIIRSDSLPDTGGNIPTPITIEPSGYTATPSPQDRNRTAPPPLFNPDTQPNRSPNLDPNEDPNGDPQETGQREPNRFGVPIPNGGNLAPPSPQNQNPSNTTTNLAPSPLVAPPPIVPPPPRAPIPPPPPPTKKEREEEERKRIVPPPIVPPPPPIVPPPVTPPLDLSGIIAQLTSIGAISALINANTQPEALRNAAKNGSCDSLKSPPCTQDMENRIKNPLEAKLDAAQIARDANAATQTGLLGSIIASLTPIGIKVTQIFEFLNRVWQNEAINKAMMYVTMITSIHNAAMLSRSLVDTLGSALDSGLQVFGLQIKDKEGNQLGISAALGQTFQALVSGIIGAENYTALNATWAQANRIYQSGTNLLSNVQSIIDSSTAVVELTSNRLGTLMNAMRNVGGVRENAYGAQSQNVTRFNAYLDKLNNLEAGVSNLASITGNIVSVQQSVKELDDNRKGLNDALKDNPIGTSLTSNTAQTNDRIVKRNETLYTINDFSIVKPPDTEP